MLFNPNQALIFPTFGCKGAKGMGGKGKGKFMGSFTPSGIAPSLPSLGNGGSKKRKNAPTPEPLTTEKIMEITETLEFNGGSITLGKLTTIFEGLKKVQLKEHFSVVEEANPGAGDAVVSLIDATFDDLRYDKTRLRSVRKKDVASLALAVPRVQNVKTQIKLEPQAVLQTLQVKAKAKKDKDPDAPPPPELDYEMISQISDFLEEQGGRCSLGKLTTNFEGLKKAQLEPHFTVIKGARGPEVCLEGTAMEPLEPIDAVHDAVPKKKKARTRNDAPVAPLAEHVLQQICAWIELQGGEGALGKLTTAFPGVKKVQLEQAGLTLSAGQGDLIVSTY